MGHYIDWIAKEFSVIAHTHTPIRNKHLFNNKYFAAEGSLYPPSISKVKLVSLQHHFTELNNITCTMNAASAAGGCLTVHLKFG